MKKSNEPEDLTKLFLAAKTNKEMEHLFEAILTPEEFSQVKKRARIIRLLLAGKTHREVAKELKLSVAKVGRGSRELKYGTGIFQKLFKRI